DDLSAILHHDAAPAAS
ncbi:hypothetical protein A2U01_0042432, partial [Trifolium medium]|nr:hypothetical protein [Trifolium medium]